MKTNQWWISLRYTLHPYVVKTEQSLCTGRFCSHPSDLGDREMRHRRKAGLGCIKHEAKKAKRIHSSHDPQRKNWGLTVVDHLRVLEGCHERCLLFGRTWKWLWERTDKSQKPNCFNGSFEKVPPSLALCHYRGHLTPCWMHYWREWLKTIPTRCLF